MRAELKSYLIYECSGTSWLGDVPEHWEVRRLKQVFHRIVGGSTPSSAEPSFWDGDVIWITPTDISKTERLSTSQRRITQRGLKSCSSELVPPGSIVVTSRAPVGNVALAEVELSTNQGCKALVTTEHVIDPVFGLYVMKTLKTELQSLATGTTFTEIATSKLGIVLVPLPPLPEQAAIVRFLDYMDRRIRRYIRAKQKLIKLLEEQKQAIIHRAVTRGLDPNVRLKPSGVEWLGDVPEHWEVQKLKQLTRFRNGLAFRPSDWSADGVPIIRIQNLNGSNDFNYTTRNDLPQFLRIQPGDLLFSWSGNRGTSFGSFIWDREFDGYLNQHIFKLDGFSLDRQYFAYLLRAVTRYVEEQTHGIIGLVHVTKPELGSVMVPIAPPEEQVVMAKFIDDHIASVNSTIYRTKQEISLLNEYRTRLIADVVTGKLDVREAAATLPHEQTESELLDEENALVTDDEFEDSDADIDTELEEIQA